MKLCMLIVVILFMASCSKEGSLPYHPPEFAPIYREECYSDHKNFLCMDKEKDASYTSPFIYFLFMGGMNGEI